MSESAGSGTVGVPGWRLDILPQPDDATCGPTCLHALYRYYGDPIDLGRVVAEVAMLETGGTMAVMLANHALHRGYDARLYTYNVQAFDPTWFRPGVDLRDRLRRQRAFKADRRLHISTRAYLEFLDRGGKVHFEDLTTRLLARFLRQGVPILTGLSATYLYRAAREFGPRDEADDIRGSPVGHFVLLYGYDRGTRNVLVADPLCPNPVAPSRHYQVRIERVVGAILLGVLTYDANLLVVRPKRSRARSVP
jgi:hypothetical protein